MKRLIGHYNNDILDLREYRTYKSDLNWRDDGNDSPDNIGSHIEDPSMNDFIKGYAEDPYSLRYWAKAKADKQLMKLAWKEIDVLSFTPEYLADKILKLWNQIDGPLQNVFEGFTLRYDNELKQKIANIINQRGYEVYPILLVDCPMYANENVVNIKGNTIAINHLRRDLNYIKNKRGYKIKARRLIAFYKQAFPNDKQLQNMNFKI